MNGGDEMIGVSVGSVKSYVAGIPYVRARMEILGRDRYTAGRVDSDLGGVRGETVH